MESIAKSPPEAEAERTSALELAASCWISEQYAARLDQLARCMGRSLRTAQRCARGLKEKGWAEVHPLLHGEHSWVWLTEAGSRLAGTGFRAWRPSLARLAHVAAVNEVRLQLAEACPHAVWVCERSLARSAEERQPRPDAVLLCGGGEQAIEVELVAKTRRRLARRLDQLCESYDSVIYFCRQGTYRQLAALRASGHWPALEVRRLPRSAGSLYATPSPSLR